MQGSGIQVVPRSVSRYLRILTEHGFLRRMGNGYEPTESAKRQSKARYFVKAVWLPGPPKNLFALYR
jgi:hypothetical protein